jgi:hypothetical protein
MDGMALGGLPAMCTTGTPNATDPQRHSGRTAVVCQPN